MQEELSYVLSISVYDVARNEVARKHRQELVSDTHSERHLVLLYNVSWAYPESGLANTECNGNVFQLWVV